MADITDDEISEIATHFLLSSPPGEFNEVLTDVRTLVNNDSLLNSCALNSFRAYNTEQMIPVKVPGENYSVLVTQHGEVNKKTYADPRSGQGLEFDHIKQVFTGDSKSYSGDSSVESLRKSVETAIDNYIKEHYLQATATVYGIDGKVVVCISSQKFDQGNFWGGSWKSTWKCSKNGKIEGKMSIHLHYYEDGNVQLKAEHSVKVSGGKSGADIAETIQKAEGDWHRALSAYYINMDETFQTLRRRLPMDKQTLNWNGLAHHKMGRELAT